MGDTFATLLRHHRSRLRLTQEALAEHTGISSRSLSDLERDCGRSARPGTVARLAEALGLDGPERDEFVGVGCAKYWDNRFHHPGSGSGSAQPAARVPPAARPVAAPRPVPAQLPADAAVFTGRADELAALSAVLTASDQVCATVAINGLGGIGKTWLAVHWAHQHLHLFPDGQLFADLRGFDPSGQPVAPAVVVRGFLDALGVPPHAVPAEPVAQVGLYRSLVAGRRMLIVLDNARDAAQVMDLLPGAGGCVVLVTSRDQLAVLVRSHSVYPLSVGVLDDGQARELLSTRLGRRRLAAEPAAAARMVAACGGLPLALGIVAARAALAPRVALETIAEEVHDATKRLETLDDDDPSSGLRMVLSWSYAMLTPPQARVFRLLGLLPGEDFGLSAAAAATGLPADELAAVLRALQRQSLLDQPTARRWRAHDLVRLYAAEQARRDLAPADRREALRRLTEYFLHTAYAAERLLDPARPPIVLDEPVLDGAGDQLRDVAAAWEWLEEEHANLLSVVRLAADEGWHASVWQLAWSLHTFHLRRGHVQDQLAVCQAALASVEQIGTDTMRALAHRRLGWSLSRAGRHDAAAEHLRHALELAARADDLPTLAQIHQSVAWACETRGDDEQALAHASRALALHRDLDDAPGTVAGLNMVGWYSARLGRYAQARTHLDAALRLSRRLGHRLAEADTLDSLGLLAHRTGDYPGALRRYRRALRLIHELGHHYSEAAYLERLGETLAAVGDVAAARQTWQQAIQLYRTQRRGADAERVLRHLDTLTDPESPI